MALRRRPLTWTERQALGFIALCVLLGVALGYLYDLTH